MLLLENINNNTIMFWKKIIRELTPKEEFEERLDKLYCEHIKAGKFKITTDWRKCWVTFPEISKEAISFDLGTYSNSYEYIPKDNKESTRMVIIEANKQRKAELDREKEIEQEKEDKEYRKKLRNLLKIKPLDKDLKESFRKANRLLEISKEIQKLRDEALKIRG